MENIAIIPIIVDCCIVVIAVAFGIFRGKIGVYDKAKSIVIWAISAAIGYIASKFIAPGVSEMFLSEYDTMILKQGGSGFNKAGGEISIPAVEKAIAVILFIVFAVISLIFLKYIKKLGDESPDSSAADFVNHFFGFVLGFAEAMIILLLIVRACDASGNDFFNNLSDGTILLKWLCGNGAEGSLETLKNVNLEDVKNLTIKDIRDLF